MEQMSSRRNPFVFIVILLLVLPAAVYFSYSFILPQYIEKKILSSLGDKLSTSLTGQVFTIGFNKASLGDLTIGDPGNVAISIGSIQADYSIFSILDKKINQIRVNGLTINLKVSEGRIIIPGLDLEKITSTKKENDISQHSSGIDLPLQLDKFEISNGFLNVLYENRPILIPFALQITREEQKNKDTPSSYKLNLQIVPQGEKITISGSIDPANNSGQLALSADSFDIKPFASLLGEFGENLNSGKASIKSNVEIKLMPFQLVAIEIDSELESVNFRNLPVRFDTLSGSDSKTRPLRLQIKGSGQQWDVSAHGSMIEPLATTISLDGTIQKGNNGTNASGTISLGITDQTVTFPPVHAPVIIKGNPELLGEFSVDIPSSGDWQVKINSTGSKETLTVSQGLNSLNAKIPALNFQGNGSADDVSMQVTLTMPEVHATGPDAAEIISPMAKLQASFKQGKKTVQNSSTSGEFSLSLPNVKFKKDTLTGMADLLLVGEILPQSVHALKALQVSGEFVVKEASAVDQENSIKINSLEARVPWQWSQSERELQGNLKVQEITLKNHKLGSFDAKVKLKDSTYILDGRFTHSLLNGLVTNIKGQAGMVDSKYQASITLQMDSRPFNSLYLGKFEPSLSGSNINGELGLEGKFDLDTNGFTGNMTVQMQNGRFEFPTKKIAISNINLSLLLPSLPDLRSAPAQELLFDKASIGDLTFEQGKIIWQLESTDSIFIEQGVVKWSGGRVFTNAVRISPNRKDFIIPIFCDRLILADILNQLGITNAEGEGTVSGRIPLLMSRGTFNFEDGFLYSSPGQGGSIKVAALELLSAGIPKNSPQFAQVDFAAEALKNFQYNWVKLLLNSEGDDLVMQMQMDGKPLQSLPFSYDSQTGLLQRLDVQTKGISQPIRLDVNFRLPLNRFLGYSGKIQDIMKKIK